MEELVSVIVPVYNVEPYLRTCVKSIWDQTYQNLEIVLVDDGSTDASGAICDELAKADRRITVIHKQNEGLSAARRTGVERATGEYVYFVDADDCINPVLIERTLREAKKYHVDIVQVEYEPISEMETEYHRGGGIDYRVQHFDNVQALLNLDKDDQGIAKDIRMITTVIWSKLYRKSLLDKVPFPKDIRIHEDQMIIHDIIAAANGMVYIDARLYYYRFRHNSLIRAEWRKEKLVILDCYQSRLKCVQNIDAVDADRKDRLVKEVFWRYLVCMFRNYVQVSRFICGKEKRKLHKNIHRRFIRESKKNKDIRLGVKKNLFIICFTLFPGMCGKLFMIRQKL